MEITENLEIYTIEGFMPNTGWHFITYKFSSKEAEEYVNHWTGLYKDYRIQKFIHENQADLPESIKWAMNSGDGVYRP